MDKFTSVFGNKGPKRQTPEVWGTVSQCTQAKFDKVSADAIGLVSADPNLPTTLAFIIMEDFALTKEDPNSPADWISQGLDHISLGNEAKNACQHLARLIKPTLPLIMSDPSQVITIMNGKKESGMQIKVDSENLVVTKRGEGTNVPLLMLAENFSPSKFA